MNIAGTIARNTLFNFIATTSDIVVTFAIGIILARSLGTEQYGLYSLLMWFLSLVAIVINMGLAEMSKRFIAEGLGRGNTKQTGELVRVTLLLRAAGALLAVFVIIVSSRFWAGLFGQSDNQTLFILFAVMVLPHSLNYALIAIFQGFQKYDYGAYIILGTSPLRLVLVIILMAMDFSVPEMIILNASLWGLGVLIGIFLVRRLVPLRSLLSPSPTVSADTKQALKYALTMAAILGVGYISVQQGEVFFLGMFSSVEQVGFYTLAFKIASMSMKAAPLALAFVLLPAIAEQFGKGDMGKVRAIYLTAVRYLMMLALPVATAEIALAGPIVNLFYGVDYTPVATLLQIIVLPLAIASIGHATGMVIFGINRPGFTLVMETVTALLNVGLSLWLIPRYGMHGAAIVCAVSRIFTLPFYIKFVARNTGARWPLKDTIKIVVASSVMGGAIYALQSQLSVALSLALCIPLGLLIYITAILTLRVVQEQDLTILKSIQNSLPKFLGKYYALIIRILERAMVMTRLTTRH